MIGSRPHIYWKIVWKFVAPFFVLGLLIVTIIKYFLTTLHYQAYDALQVSWHHHKSKNRLVCGDAIQTPVCIQLFCFRVVVCKCDKMARFHYGFYEKRLTTEAFKLFGLFLIVG